MKKVIFAVVLAFSVSSLSAQQDAQFSHFFFNNLGVNPGASGINEAICANVIHREQWVGFAGRPRTTAFNVSMPLLTTHGIGLAVINDQLGASSDFGAKLNYAYHVTLPKGKLGIGLDLGIINKKLDFSQFDPVDPTDPFLVNKSAQGAMKMDLGFGLFYKSPKLWFGISSQKLLGGEIKYSNATSHIVRHYYIAGGYDYRPNQTWTIKPSFIVKSDAAATQFDFNTLVEWQSRFWVGASYRYQDALAGMLGMYIPTGNTNMTAKVGYSYDFTTSGLSDPTDGGSQGSHEIYLGFCFKKPPPPKDPKYLDPTWFNM